MYFFLWKSGEDVFSVSSTKLEPNLKTVGQNYTYFLFELRVNFLYKIALNTVYINIYYLY